MISFGRINPYKFVNCTVELEEIEYDSIFENNDWDTINKVLTTSIWSVNNPPWPVGSEKRIHLGEPLNQDIEVEILGYNHDNLGNESGNKAPITLGFKQAIKDDAIMMCNYNYNNSRYSSYDGKSLSSFVSTDTGYPYLINTVLPAFPSDLKKYVRLITKPTAIAVGDSPEIRNDNMRISMYSEMEIYNVHTIGLSKEGEQYKLFQIDSNRHNHILGIDGDSNAVYWMRSPHEKCYWSFDNDAFPFYEYPNGTNNIVPIFGFSGKNIEVEYNITNNSTYTIPKTAVNGETITFAVEGANPPDIKITIDGTNEEVQMKSEYSAYGTTEETGMNIIRSTYTFIMPNGNITIS